VSAVQGGSFDSGSTGADGAFDLSTDPPTVPPNTIIDGNNFIVPLPESGVYSFTTVNIPADKTVKFMRNARNTPVTILAQEAVTVAGTINLDGELGGTLTPNHAGRGGPGGFDGGDGGIAAAGRAGTAGGGPGGGEPGIVDPGNAQFGLGGGGGSYAGRGGNGQGSAQTFALAGALYGVPTLVPLVGGSGGGGGAAHTINNGGGGGGGGGAILIASSATITVNGTISVNGGTGGGPGACCDNGAGGGGSGGAIRLITNTIAGTGRLLANGGGGGSGTSFGGGPGGVGRIRLEAFNLAFDMRPDRVVGVVATAQPGPVVRTDLPTLRIASVAGVSVSGVPAGNFSASPDIILPAPQSAPVTVALEATGIPPGTIVEVSVAPASDVRTVVGSTALTGTLQSSTATAQVTLPPGVSVISATALFAVPEGGMSQAQPSVINGERVTHLRVGTSFGHSGTEIVYITESGRRVSVRR
jgi:hypothetical protein